MEAIWTRFLPSTGKVMEILKNNELGQLQTVYSDLGFWKEYDPEHRLFDPEKGGGALLDIGIYPVFISMLTAGKPEKIQAAARFAKTGIDQSCHMVCEHPGGVISSLNCTLVADSPVETHLLFEKGRICMESWWIKPAPVTIHRNGEAPERVTFPEPGTGYQYEAAEVMRCLDNDLTESPMLPLDFSLDLMETLDRVRSITGIVYPQDQNSGSGV